MFRLTIYPAICIDANANIQKEFKTFVELKSAKDTAVDMLLFIQDEMNVMKDYSNMFVEESLVDGEWEEIDDWMEEAF